jgi:hypothetical protein
MSQQVSVRQEGACCTVLRSLSRFGPVMRECENEQECVRKSLSAPLHTFRIYSGLPQALRQARPRTLETLAVHDGWASLHVLVMVDKRLESPWD